MSYDLVIFCWATFGYWYFSKRTYVQYKIILLRKLIDFYYIDNGCCARTLWKETRSYLDFLSLCTGWNHRWCLHGSFRFTDEKWTSPCARNREIVIKPLKRNYVFQNTTQTKTAIKAPDRNPFRYWIKWREENDFKKNKIQRSLLFVN